MKTKFTILIAALAATLLLSSCNEKSGPDYTFAYPNAIVTAKTSAEGNFYLQLDDKTTLHPVNVSKSPFGDKEVRALCNFEFIEGKSEHFDRNVRLNWIDSVRTKSTVLSLGSEDADELAYGDAPIEIYNDWVTVLEDGYLTLSFAAIWGNPNIKHSIDLVAGVDEDDPFLLELRHNDELDNIYYGGTKAHGIIAFKLNNLPDTKGETVKLKIRFNSLFGGERTISFPYTTGASTTSSTELPVETLSRGLAVE